MFLTIFGPFGCNYNIEGKHLKPLIGQNDSLTKRNLAVNKPRLPLVRVT